MFLCSYITSISVPIATWCMGHLCKQRWAGKEAHWQPKHRPSWPPLSCLSTQRVYSGGHLPEVQIASNPGAILIGPSHNFPSGDLGTNLPIMFQTYQVPDQLTNSLATIHESAHSRKIQVLSSFMPSGQPDVVPKVLLTGRSPPTYRATQYKHLLKPASSSPSSHQLLAGNSP